MVAIPAPSTIKINPRTSALHACHKQRDVIFPRITSTFQVAPEAGWARLNGPSEFFLRIPGVGAMVLYSVNITAAAAAVGDVDDCCGSICFSPPPVVDEGVLTEPPLVGVIENS